MSAARRRALVVVAGVVMIAATALLWHARRPATPPLSLAPVTTTDRPAPESALREPATTNASTTHADARARLHARLDAIEQAYNDGDVRAASLALWENHAVVRPNGENLDRDGVLRNWEDEWTRLQNRKLALAILSFEAQGDLTHATWSIDLAGDVLGEDGQLHRYELHGVQQASYRTRKGEERLEGPITYAAFDQMLDGEPWGGSQ